MTPDRTAAAIEARRRAAEQKLQQVRDAIADLRRHKTPVTYPAVARQAGVSRTFLYANPDARALISKAISTGSGPKTSAPGTGSNQEPSWRERALNAEAALTTAHAEIAAQRRHGWPPRTPRSSSASASSPTTTGPWRNGWKPPAPTTALPTGASPSSKPSSPSAHQPADRARLPHPRHRPRSVPATFTSRTCTRRESPGQNLAHSPAGRKRRRGVRQQHPAAGVPGGPRAGLCAAGRLQLPGHAGRRDEAHLRAGSQAAGEGQAAVGGPFRRPGLQGPAVVCLGADRDRLPASPPADPPPPGHRRAGLPLLLCPRRPAAHQAAADQGGRAEVARGRRF